MERTHAHRPSGLPRFYNNDPIRPDTETAVANILDILRSQHAGKGKVTVIHHHKVMVSPGHLVEFKHHNTPILANIPTQEKTK
jgi:hypothetical protein